MIMKLEVKPSHGILIEKSILYMDDILVYKNKSHYDSDKLIENKLKDIEILLKYKAMENLVDCIGKSNTFYKFKEFKFIKHDKTTLENIHCELNLHYDYLEYDSFQSIYKDKVDKWCWHEQTNDKFPNFNYKKIATKIFDIMIEKYPNEYLWLGNPITKHISKYALINNIKSNYLCKIIYEYKHIPDNYITSGIEVYE